MNYLARGNYESPRRAFALFTVIAILAVGMIVLGWVARQTVDDVRQCRLRHEHRQCCRLSEAGMARGAARLADNADYEGETWTIAAADLGLPRDATVVIEVNDEAIVATAAYPAGDAPRIRHTETLSLTN